MRKIILKTIEIENFKGIKKKSIDFSNQTEICGVNASGKTTIVDAWNWLLFDKDSNGVSKFQIRPLDSSSQQIDFVEIMVEANISIDDKEVSLKKVQKQNWVKDRTTQEQKFKGNVNEYEVNGYPKSEKEFKEYISGLLDEELFKLITDPTAFTSLPWKKQREVLMKLVDEVSDLEVAKTDDNFLPLIPELEIASTDDIAKKYNKAMKEWKKKQIELPARIDELSKQLADTDTAELKLQANSLREQIEEVSNKYEDSSSALSEHDKISSETIQLKGKMRQIAEAANNSLMQERKEVQSRADEATEEFEKSRSQIRLSEMRIEQLKKAVAQNEDKKVQLQEAWKAEKVKSYPEYEEIPRLNENALTCPTCGQELPKELKTRKIAEYDVRRAEHQDEYNKSKEIFDKNKKKLLADIEEQGKRTVDLIKKEKTEIEQLEKVIQQEKEKTIELNGVKAAAIEELSKLPQEADLSENQEYEALQTELSNLEESLRNMNTGADYRNQLKIRLTGLREELSMTEKKIASADNTVIEERISELKEEQRKIGQKVANQEKMIELLEKFIRAKIDKVTEGINGKFKIANFIMYKRLINGGMSECCEVEYNGIPYSDLNSGHKIVVGLDIIDTMQKLYEINAPVFIDNAESINDFNIPDMESQVVLLKVSDDKVLSVADGIAVKEK